MDPQSSVIGQQQDQDDNTDKKVGFLGNEGRADALQVCPKCNENVIPIMEKVDKKVMCIPCGKKYGGRDVPVCPNCKYQLGEPASEDN